MNVYQFAAKCPNETGGQDSHEPGQYDEVRVVAKNVGRERRIELLPGAEIIMVNHKSLNVSLPGPFKREGSGLVAAQSNNLSRKVSLPGGVNQRLKIGSASGSQNQNSGKRRLVCLHFESSPDA